MTKKIKKPLTKKIKKPRPNEKFSPQLVDNICSSLAQGSTLQKTCKKFNIDTKTFYKWMDKYPEVESQYIRAKQECAELLAEEILEIADDGTNDYMMLDGREVINQEHVQRSKLRIDARKWMAGKLKPKKYGDSHTVKGDSENPLAVINLAAMIDAAQKIK